MALKLIIERVKPFLLHVLDILSNVLFKFIFIFKRRTPRKCRYYLTLCAIFKNEGPYLKEWIEYHILIGVDHIYLYNNFSSDDYIDVLQTYIEDGYITLVDWPYPYSQISAYNNCFEKFGDETFWMMFLDIDEFICPLEKDNIKDWLQPYEKYPSVLIYWLMFGTNGIIEYDPTKLVIEQYTNSWSSVRNESKQILNTAYVPVKMYHHCIYCWVTFLFWKFKVPSINEDRHFITNHGKEKCPKNGTIQINHYWSKCLNEYIRKIDKGDIFSNNHNETRKLISFFYWHELKNVSENKTIYRFLIKLKVRMLGIDDKFQ